MFKNQLQIQKSTSNSKVKANFKNQFQKTVNYARFKSFWRENI